MKILFLTDSLALPRKHKDEVVLYEETYPFLLKKTFPQYEFVFLSIGGATIETLYKQAHYYQYFNPDLVFLHCGIVDCAPRAFSKFERLIIGKLKLLKFVKLFSFYLRKYRKHQYTSKQKFNITSNLLRKKIFTKSTFYALGILPAFDEYETKVPGITESIKEYKLLIQKHFKYIDNSDFPNSGFLPDFFHLNKKGHLYIFTKLVKIINE